MNPRAVAVMARAGIDISDRVSKDVAELPLAEIDTVVTLCGDAAKRCPAFPGAPRRLHWPLSDPARASGPPNERDRVLREVRDEIGARVRALFQASAPGRGPRPVAPPRPLAIVR